MAITLEQAKQLQPGEWVYSCREFNRRGQPKRVKVNGRVRTWKRTPDRVQVPWKRGLYEFGYLTERDLEDFCLTADEAVNSLKE